MEIKVGEVYRCKTGELFQVDSYDPKASFQFCMLNPKTKERSDFSLEGESAQLPGWFKEVDAQQIDLKTYEPTGLVNI